MQSVPRLYNEDTSQVDSQSWTENWELIQAVARQVANQRGQESLGTEAVD
jgi:hypothetical protein